MKSLFVTKESEKRAQKLSETLLSLQEMDLPLTALDLNNVASHLLIIMHALFSASIFTFFSLLFRDE